MGEVHLIPTEKIIKKLGIEPNGRIQAFFTEDCLKRMDKYVPMRDTPLRTTTDVQSNSITYQSIYANYQYHGMRRDGTHVVKNYTTPGTGSYWDRKMVSAEINELIEDVENAIKKGM